MNVLRQEVRVSSAVRCGAALRSALAGWCDGYPRCRLQLWASWRQPQMLEPFRRL